jgi:hypothetical protein
MLPDHITASSPADACAGAARLSSALIRAV